MRLIDIEDMALLKTVSCGGLSAKKLWKRIKEQPTIDAVEVVRCKDCIHWLQHEQFGFDEDNDEYHDYCGLLIPEDEYYAYTRKSDDYCSYGERKGGDTE